MAAQGAHIEIKHAGVVFDDGAEELRALQDLSVSIGPGESVALIGPSGCGKSTTLRLLAGLLAPSEGEVLVNGQVVARPRQATALIPQDLGLLPWKTVLQNAALGLVIRGVPKDRSSAMAREALAKVGLEGFERSYPKSLSGGMRQRLALARALAMDADLLLMDEPLSAVDALLRESLQDTLLELWLERGHTQMFVTHSIEEAVFLGERILVFSARPATLIADFANPRVGSEGWRDSLEFLALCNELRRALAHGAKSGEDAFVADGAAGAAAVRDPVAGRAEAPADGGQGDLSPRAASPESRPCGSVPSGEDVSHAMRGEGGA